MYELIDAHHRKSGMAWEINILSNIYFPISLIDEIL